MGSLPFAINMLNRLHDRYTLTELHTREHDRLNAMYDIYRCFYSVATGPNYTILLSKEHGQQLVTGCTMDKA